MQLAPSIHKVDSTVKVELSKLEDRIPEDLFRKLSKSPTGKIVEYKMTDGQGVGVIILLNDGSYNWFFTEEICPCSEETKFSREINSFKNNPNSNFEYEQKTDLLSMINPVNFFNWLIHSLSDVI